MKKYSGLVVVGSVGFDVVMNLPGLFRDFIMPDKLDRLNVSFTVDSLRKEYGGTGGNCAYSLGLLGIKPRLLSILGKDGGAYRERLAQAGVDVSELSIQENAYSAVGHVMTDREHNQLWSYYPGALTGLQGVRLQDKVKRNDFVALLPSTPDAFKRHVREVIEMGNDFMFDPAFFIPNLTADELKLGLAHATVIIGNDYEIALMERKAKRRLGDWLTGRKVVITTLGDRGSVIRQGKGVWEIPIAPATQVVDPTGAGDAYRAGFLAGWMRGESLEACGRQGALAATYTVETCGTQAHPFTNVKFRERLETAFTNIA